jgi:hypothetical protein
MQTTTNSRALSEAEPDLLLAVRNAFARAALATKSKRKPS